MPKISEYATFFREFRRSFMTTGAVAPSGRMLARALAKPLDRRNGPARVLEVGPGTGAITRELVRHIRNRDVFHLVEVNERFVESLRKRFEREPEFRRVADQSTIYHLPIQELQVAEPYDFIISGLPVNNFSMGLVKSLFRHMLQLLRPGGTLSFYEYLWIRRVKMLVANGHERRRVARVGRVLNRFLDRYEFQCEKVIINMPPAVAHHLRLETSPESPEVTECHDAVVRR